MLKEVILSNWRTDINGYAQSIAELEETDYPAWTVKFPDSYGVAIPYEGNEEINESFASAKIRSSNIRLSSGTIIKTLILTTEAENIKSSFAVLCEALVDPGVNGLQRKQIVTSPVMWWKDWKELLGNRNIDARIYDVLGELCVLKHVVESGMEAEWNGPDGATYDIETDSGYIEVKSSINRSRREVTISSDFQLFPPNKPLDLVFCCFEPSVLNGFSIDDVLIEFQAMGYNTAMLNRKLESRGFEQGMSSRRKKFILHEMLRYIVNESFPRITPESFVGGERPAGITKITYTVDLAGLVPISLLAGDNNDI